MLNLSVDIYKIKTFKCAHILNKTHFFFQCDTPKVIIQIIYLVEVVLIQLPLRKINVSRKGVRLRNEILHYEMYVLLSTFCQ